MYYLFIYLREWTKWTKVDEWTKWTKIDRNGLNVTKVDRMD